MIEEKFVCPCCGFESNGAGICPSCDEDLQKVCACGSGKFSAECCSETESAETKKEEDLIKAEVASEALSEIAEENKKRLEEEQELENVKEVEE